MTKLYQYVGVPWRRFGDRDLNCRGFRGDAPDATAAKLPMLRRFYSFFKKYAI